WVRFGTFGWGRHHCCWLLSYGPGLRGGSRYGDSTAPSRQEAEGRRGTGDPRGHVSKPLPTPSLRLTQAKLEGSSKSRRALKTALGVPRQRLHDDAVERSRQLPIAHARARRNRRRGNFRSEQGRNVERLTRTEQVRRQTGDHFVEHRTKRVDVRSLIRFGTSRLLGRHVRSEERRVGEECR